MNWKKDTKEFQQRAREYDKVKYMCKCGRKAIIPKRLNKVICDWCGNYVFKTKKDEDIYRIKQKIKEKRKNDGY
jgi:predicted SprT family Zn-dependent metalloprotease